MKHIYLFFAILCFNLTFSQNEVSGDWYLYHINVDGSLYYNADLGDDHPTMTFTTDSVENGLSYSGVVCNSYGGEYTINENIDQITITSFSATLAGCIHFNTEEFENDYFSILTSFNADDTVLNYSISGEENNEVLLLTNTDSSDYAVYGRYPQTQEILGEWFLHYLIVDAEQIYNPNPFSPGTINFSTTPNMVGFYLEGTAACNSFMSDYYFNPQQTFSMEFLSPTLGICDSMEETDFEDAFFNSVLLHPQADITEFSQEIIGAGNDATLVITNIFHGNQAVYGRQVLSVDENEYASSSITLNKNPVDNLISLSVNNGQITSYEIYSITGQLVSKGTINSNSINARLLQSGLYFLKVLTEENKAQILKFIKK